MVFGRGLRGMLERWWHSWLCWIDQECCGDVVWGLGKGRRGLVCMRGLGIGMQGRV